MECTMGILLLRAKPEESATWEQKQIFMDELQLLNSLSWLTSFVFCCCFLFFLSSLLRGQTASKQTLFGASFQADIPSHPTASTLSTAPLPPNAPLFPNGKPWLCRAVKSVIFLHDCCFKLDCIPVFQLSGEHGKKIFIALALHDQGEGWLFEDALLMNARGHPPLLRYEWLVTEKCREINSQVFCLLWLFCRCVTLDIRYL